MNIDAIGFIIKSLVDKSFESTLLPVNVGITYNEESVVVLSTYTDGVVVRSGANGKDLVSALMSLQSKMKNIEMTETTYAVLEIINELTPYNILNVYATKDFSDQRFEQGVNGLMAITKDKNLIVYGPHEAYSMGHIVDTETIKEVLKRISPSMKNLTDINVLEDKCKMFYKTSSEAFLLTPEMGCHKLYRGKVESNKIYCEKLMKSRFDRALRNLSSKYDKSTGKFDYYYNGLTGSNRSDTASGYDIMAHNISAYTLLDIRTISPEVLEDMKGAIEVFTNTLSKKEVKGAIHYYSVFEDSASLGCTSTGLSLVCKYLHYSALFDMDVSKLENIAKGLVNHILSRIDKVTNEPMSYYFKKDFNDGDIIDTTNLTDDEMMQIYENDSYGQALYSLVSYFDRADYKTQNNIRTYVNKVCKFMISDRTFKYPDQFTSLIDDKWFILAIDKMYDSDIVTDKELKHEMLKWSVEVTRKLLEHTYSRRSTMYDDYYGAFFINAGDLPLYDPMKVVGLISSARILRKVGGYDNMLTIIDKNIDMTVESVVMNTFIDRDDGYSYIDKEKVSGSFRGGFMDYEITIEDNSNAISMIDNYMSYLTQLNEGCTNEENQND